MKAEKLERRRNSTRALHADRGMDQDFGVSPAIHQSVNYRAVSGTDFALKAGEPLNDGFYARHGNPTASRMARIIAELEGAEAAMMTASGMGAIASTVLALVESGDHVIGQTSHYIGTSKLLTDVLSKFGVRVTRVDQRDTQAFADAIERRTRLVIMETPVNPTMRLTDLAAVAAMARDRGVMTMCDNTVATSLLQRPLELGVDIVCHSATKYIGGHHDLLAGAVVGSRAILERVWNMSMCLGPVAAPFNAWLALRGVRTMQLRVDYQCRSALAIAEFLSAHPKIAEVNYPGLPQHPQHELARRQMSAFGGLLSFELKGGFESGRAFVSALEIPLNAASLGGVESLVIQPSVMWGARMATEQVASQEIGDGLIRMAIGIEDTEDLISDIAQALERI